MFFSICYCSERVPRFSPLPRCYKWFLRPNNCPHFGCSNWNPVLAGWILTFLLVQSRFVLFECSSMAMKSSEFHHRRAIARSNCPTRCESNRRRRIDLWETPWKVSKSSPIRSFLWLWTIQIWLGWLKLWKILTAHPRVEIQGYNGREWETSCNMN